MLLHSHSQQKADMTHCCRLQQNCKQQEAAREQLQYSIRSELDTRGLNMWPSGSLSSRIYRALQDDPLQGQMAARALIEQDDR